MTLQVLDSKVPLSSDAFSPFGKEDMKAQNANVEAAFIQIEMKIQKFVKDFEREEKNPYDFCTTLHSYGINIRYLGKVIESAQSGIVFDLALVEVISRTIKLEIWSKWRLVVQQGYVLYLTAPQC